MASRTDPAAATEGGVFIAPKTEVLYLLVAADDSTDTARLRAAMIANRCACDFVDGAANAVRAFIARDYDLILLSLHTTAEQMTATVDELRRNERRFPEPRIPLFVLARGVILEQREKVLASGADDVIPRADDYSDLYQAIERTVSLERRTPPELISREPVSYSTVLDRCGDDAALAWQQITEFRTLLGQSIAELKESLATENSALARRSAETLRLAAIDLKSARCQRTAYLATKLDRIPRGQFASRTKELLADMNDEARDLDTWIELGLGQVIISRPPTGPLPPRSPLAQSENFLRRMEAAGSTWAGLPGGGLQDA